MNKLKPCPFCGSKVEIDFKYFDVKKYFSYCTKKDCIFDSKWIYKTKKEAGKEFNKRNA